MKETFNYQMTREEKTVEFIKRYFPEGTRILDLGVPNKLGKLMSKNGFIVENTQGEDLDVQFNKYTDTDAKLVTAFQIFEHMLAPFNLLRELNCEHLIASVPLNLWFAKAYWNESEVWDRHYHEFEQRQFDMLLDRTGWNIIDRDKWANPSPVNGIRPLLRKFAKRHYIVYCRRKHDFVVPGQSQKI